MGAKDIKQLSVEQQQLVEAIAANVAICQKSVLSAPEAAAYMNVSLSYLYKLTHRQQIPFSKPLGKMMFFSRPELERWLLSNRVATADEINDQAQAYCAHTRTNLKKERRTK